jgi:hypothetical protein
MRRALACALVACGCAPARFVERDVVWREPDARSIPQPRENPIAVDWSGMRDTVFLPLDRALTIDYGVEAANVNALDEVPESSWFHDPRRDSPEARLRPRALTSFEMEWGAASPDDVPVQPLTVIKGKAIGATRGFVAKDARGVRYLIKLDPPGRPGFATAVEVVVSRLAWACGYRVPSEVMIEVPIRDLKIAPSATHKDEWGHTVPFGRAELNRLLDDLPVDAEGKMLMLASRWLDGVNIGPYRYFGRRDDDTNDLYAHENRRDLRGFGVFSAWVNNTDTLENNTLDMYVGAPGRGHVVHYAQDVGGAFGVWAFGPMPYWMGHETYFDVPHIFRALLSFGFASGYWEDERFRAAYDARVTGSPVLGGFDIERFDPRAWRPSVPNPAFARQTRRDRYWAAKHIALVDERELRAAIAAGHYDAENFEHVFKVLWARRERVLRAYFADVAALDYFRIDGARLCFDDAWLRAGLGGEARYHARDGARRLAIAPLDSGGCVDAPASGYHVVELRVDRTGNHRPPVRVHLSSGKIVGVEH